jgi:ribosomal protein S18 acetylase RimI-like enzyme
LKVSGALPEQSFRILPAGSAADIDDAAAQFRAYAASLSIDLTYQDFEAELAALPGKYAPPSGALLLARGAGGDALGCVALRPLGELGFCEMKRLYVDPSARGLGLGKALVEVILHEAGRLGYAEMRLDTLPSMKAALALYGSFGFERIGPYYDTPVPGTVFLAKRLHP